MLLWTIAESVSQFGWSMKPFSLLTQSVPQELRQCVCPVPADFLFQTYQNFGGVETGDQMVGRMTERWPQPISRLARWVVQRQVVNFHWHGTLYLPLFQFDLSCAWLRNEVPRVMDMLPRNFDDEEVAEWFARPSGLLEGDIPAHALLERHTAVMEAARATRFLCQ